MSRWYVRENRVSSLGIRSGELAKSLIILKMIGVGKGLSSRFGTTRDILDLVLEIGDITLTVRQQARCATGSGSHKVPRLLVNKYLDTV